MLDLYNQGKNTREISEEARMSFLLDSDYKSYINKNIRMTIEEKKITIEKIEE